jgi:hypothetical protein
MDRLHNPSPACLLSVPTPNRLPFDPNLANEIANASSGRHLDPMAFQQYAYNPSILDELTMLVRISPWNLCNGGTNAAKERHAMVVPGLEDMYQMAWLDQGRERQRVHRAEDGRAIRLHGDIWMVYNRPDFATSVPGKPNERVHTMRLTRLQGKRARRHDVQLLWDGANHFAEKNWAPFVHNEALYMSYRCM